MLDETSDAGQVMTERGAPHVAARTPSRSDRRILRSATRPLEVIELFAVHRRPLSVSEIACALEIPQSSSSVLLQAMNGAGFVARDRRTRKYIPSVRSVLLGDCVRETFRRRGGLLQALEALSAEAGANVRLGVRRGVHVQYVHVSWPDGEPGAHRLGPGMKLLLGADALGRMLLLGESEPDVRRIVRHGNAVGPAAEAIHVESLVGELCRHRTQGFALCRDHAGEDDLVLAVGLPARFGAPAAIGLGLSAARLPAEHARLVGLLRDFSAQAWAREGDMEDGTAAPAGTV